MEVYKALDEGIERGQAPAFPIVGRDTKILARRKS